MTKQRESGIAEKRKEWRREISLASKQFDEDLFGGRGSAGLQYLRLPLQFLALMTNDEALALAYLWWKRYGLELGGKLAPDGAFFMTVRTIERHIQIPASRQQRLFKRLGARGYVEISYRGVPKKRYFRINKALICADVLETYNRDCAPDIAEFRKDPNPFRAERTKQKEWDDFQ